MVQQECLGPTALTGLQDPLNHQADWRQIDANNKILLMMLVLFFICLYFILTKSHMTFATE